jgi:hypothetical protein
VPYRKPADSETGGSFTLKRCSSEREVHGNGGWRHTLVTVSATTPASSPIVLLGHAVGSIEILAEFGRSARRVRPASRRFPNVQPIPRSA